MKMAVLVADAFQDSEYFLPKIEIEKLGVTTEVISIRRDPIEIYSFFSRIGTLDVQATFDTVDPRDYIGVLVPGGARSPATLSQNIEARAFVRAVNERGGLIAPICRGALLPAAAGVVSGRRVRGFHLDAEYPELVVRPAVQDAGGLWVADLPVVVDGNLISSRHPDDVPHFAYAIRQWLQALAGAKH